MQINKSCQDRLAFPALLNAIYHTEKSTKGSRLQMESDHQCWMCCQNPGIFHNFTVNCSHSDAACQRNVAVPGYYILLGISAPWRIFLTVFFGLHKIQSECISVHFSGQLRHEIDHKLSWFVLEMLKVGSFCVSVTLVDMNAFNSTSETCNISSYFKYVRHH